MYSVVNDRFRIFRGSADSFFLNFACFFTEKQYLFKVFVIFRINYNDAQTHAKKQYNGSYIDIVYTDVPTELNNWKIGLVKSASNTRGKTDVINGFSVANWPFLCITVSYQTCFPSYKILFPQSSL